MKTTPCPPPPITHACEICGKPAKMRFLEHAGDTAQRVWRNFCPPHGDLYLLGLPESEFESPAVHQYR